MTTLNLDKLSFCKGTIGEDLERCPDCDWDGDYVKTYCKPCEESVDLMIAFLKNAAARHR